MAVIQTIREKYAKLAGFVIALSLVGFILMDAFQSGGRLQSLFGGGNWVAKVGGTKISVEEFNTRATEYENLQGFFSGQPVTSEQRAGIREQVLNSMIYEKQVEKEAAELGLTVTPAEEKDMVSGPQPDQAIQQLYQKLTGQQGYDPQFPAQLEREAKRNPDVREAYNIFLTLKQFLVRNKLQQKYDAMIGGSVYTPKAIAELEQNANLSLAGVRYVKVPYTAIPDAEVKVTDADLKAYMDKHKGMFRTDQETRNIEYVAFDVVPSAKDTTTVLTSMRDLQPKLIATTEYDNFIGRESDEPYTNAWVTKNGIMSQYADTLLGLPVGGTFGPYFENGSYRLTKLVDRRTLPDSVRVRHILVKTADGQTATLSDSAAKARIDSVVAMINGGVPFDSVARRYSEDPGSKDSGGKYTFALDQRAGLTKEFGDFAFEGATGEKKTVKVVSQGYSGYHYIEILGQEGQKPAVKLATISKPLAPSSTASDEVYGRANTFASTVNGKGAEFDNAVRKMGLNKRVADGVKPADFQIQGLGASSRELIRWAYTADPGDVSSVLSLGNNERYVVAKLTGKQAAGVMGLNASLRPQVEMLVRNEKKAALLAAKYKGNNSLDGIAAASGQPVTMADSLHAGNSSLGQAGFEPRVVGYAFYPKLPLNTVSPALSGRDGVYFIAVAYRATMPVSEAPAMMDQIRMMGTGQIRNSLAQALPVSMSRKYPVKYNPKDIN